MSFTLFIDDLSLAIATSPVKRLAHTSFLHRVVVNSKRSCPLFVTEKRLLKKENWRRCLELHIYIKVSLAVQKQCLWFTH